MKKHSTNFLLAISFFLFTLGVYNSVSPNPAMGETPPPCEICDVTGNCESVDGTPVAGTDACIEYLPPAQACIDAGDLCNEPPGA